MEKISLLPPEIKARHEARRKQRVLFIGLFGALVVVVCIYAFLMVSTILTRQDLQSLQDERQAVEQEAAALQEYADLDQKLTTYKTLISEAMGTIPLWDDLLGDLSRTLPVGSWLSELNMTYSEETGSLTMRGWAYNHSGVAEMLEQVHTLDQLDQIECRVSIETEYEGMEAVEFTLDSKLLSGPGLFPDDRGGE